MVTAELAAGLPVLVLILAAALAAVSVAGMTVRAQDVAREAARTVARGGSPPQSVPGAIVQVRHAGDEVVATVRMVSHPLGGLFPPVTVNERAVAAAEPSAPP